MADRGDTHYSIPALNRWFLVSSVLLLAGVVWMMLDDHSRPWKEYQREFRRLELGQAEAEIEQLSEQGALEREADLQRALAEAQALVEARSADVDRAQEELRRARGVAWKAWAT